MFFDYDILVYMKEVIYRFEKAEDYKLVPVNNIYGNVTNTGEIFVILFLNPQRFLRRLLTQKPKKVF